MKTSLKKILFMLMFATYAYEAQTGDVANDFVCAARAAVAQCRDFVKKEITAFRVLATGAVLAIGYYAWKKNKQGVSSQIPTGKATAQSTEPATSSKKSNTFSDLFNNALVSKNIASFLTVLEAIRFGEVNKTCNRIGNVRSRCAHAASVFKELMKELVLEGHTNFINSIAVMPDGRIVSGSSDRTIRVWNPAIAAGQPGHVVVLAGHTDFITGIAVMPDGRIVSGSWDCTIRVWNPAIAAGQPGHVVFLEGHTDGVDCIAVMPDGRIVSGSWDCTVRVWDPAIAAGQPGHVVVLEGHTGRVSCIAVMPDGRIVSGSSDRAIRVRTIRVWNPAIAADQPRHMIVLQVYYDASVSSIAVLPNGCIAAGLNDGNIRVFPIDGEKYFQEKVARTRDPRDYERDGAEIYKILFSYNQFSVWFKNFIKAQGEEEIVDVLECLIRMNFILDETHALQFKKSLDAGSFAQAQLILTKLTKIKSPTLARRLVNALGELKYFNQWLNMLGKKINKVCQVKSRQAKLQHNLLSRLLAVQNRRPLAALLIMFLFISPPKILYQKILQIFLRFPRQPMVLGR
jgi:hypothetical protein